MGEEKGKSDLVLSECETIAALVRTTAEQCRGDGMALLGLLRLLESLHRQIRDELFQEALPQNRQELYALLRDIEADGGWPYISRMKLRSLLIHFLGDEEDDRRNLEHND